MRWIAIGIGSIFGTGVIAQVTTPELLTPSFLSLLGNGSAAAAVIIVTRMFLMQQRETHTMLITQQNAALQSFADKLQDIEERHARVDKERQAQLRDALNRSIRATETLATRLAELKGSLDLQTQSTMAHEALLEQLTRSADQNLRIVTDTLNEARSIRGRDDTTPG